MIVRAIVLAALAASLLAPHASAALGPAAVPAERALYDDAPTGMYLLDSGWSSRPDPRNAGLRQRWQDPAATAGFRLVTVPNAFNARDLSRASFTGRVHWYRVRFEAPAAAGAVGWRVRFESVNVDATVWLNGRRLGRHRGAYLPFELPLGKLKNGPNEMVVRVDSRGRASDLPPANRQRGWWNFGGILREVYLRKVSTFDLRNLQVTTTTGDPATVQVRADAHNASAASAALDLRLTATGPDGFSFDRDVRGATVAAGGTGEVRESFSIPAPRLWSPADPALYRLRITVPGGQTTTATFGVRKWAVSGSGHVLLNGQPVDLRGASFHEQTAPRGAALTPADREEIVRELKAIGAGIARQHYPPHPALLEAFDRAGIVYWEQIPVWRVRETQLASAAYRRRALGMLRAAVLRDRNHASVMTWSVANETLRGGRGETRYLTAARDLIRALDPTRLVAVDKSLRPLDDIPPSYGLVDVIGLNEYVGWYGGRTPELRGNLADVHRRFPRQALFITEFGAEANRSGPASRKGTYAFQQRLLRDHLGIFDSTSSLSGALVWALRDFAVRPGWDGGNPRPRPPWLFKGLFNAAGSPKPAAALVRQMFEGHRAG